MRAHSHRGYGASFLTGCALFLCGTVLAAGSASAGEGPQCGIRTEKRGGLFVLHAVASSVIPDSGRYEFLVSKQNAGGTSRNVQSGDFSLKPGVEAVLSTLAMEAAAQGHVTARLTVQSRRGVSTCTFPRR